MKQALIENSFDSWRTEARRFLRDQVHPSEILWTQDSLSLFGATVSDSNALHANSSDASMTSMKVPKAFVDLAQLVSCARCDDKWELLYRLLYRLKFESPILLEVNTDTDVHRAYQLSKSVRRDIHKMHAFVRFKETLVNEEGVQSAFYVAWHRPEHQITRLAAPFFARRFGDRRFSIFTPDESAHWNLEELHFGKGLEQNEFLVRDEWDDLWKTYYKSIFNPARIKMKAMKAEMSPKYWSSLPEASLIPELVRAAPKTLQKMIEGQNSAARVEAVSSLEALREAASSCRACPLFMNATQTVFGDGPGDASIMIIGEQPGDEEDLAGLPFKGPAGKVLDEALIEAGLVRANIYVTNAVKHFKHVSRGKTRLHQKPNGSEIHACKPWLENEIAKIQPKVIVALGATAALAVLGRLPKISQERGQVMAGSSLAPQIIISWHPSAILRSSNSTEATERRRQLSADLALAHSAIDVTKEKGPVIKPRALSSDRPPL